MWPLIVAGVAAGKFLSDLSDLNKSFNMDEDSRKLMKNAFQRETYARLLVKQKSQ